jgi:Flp pilus assembly protein TadD
MNAEDSRGAEAQFSLASRLDPTYAEAWKKLAAVQFLLEEYAGARESLERSLAIEPAHFGALSGMGMLLLKESKPSEAVDAFEAASLVHPMAPGPRVNQVSAQGRSMLRDLDRWLVPVIPQMSTVVITLLVLSDVAGSANLQLSDSFASSQAPIMSLQSQEVRKMLPDGTRETRQVMNRVMKTGAPLEELSSLIGELDSNVVKPEISERLLDELAAAETPQRASTIAQLVWQSWLYHEDADIMQLVQEGADLMAEGELRSAETLFFKAAFADPKFAEAWNKLATVHYLMGDFQTSLSDIDRTLSLEPRHFGALSGRGLVLMEMDRFEEAASSFREALELIPASPRLALDVEFAEARSAEASGATSKLIP